MLKMLFPFTQDMHVLSAEGQQRIELFGQIYCRICNCQGVFNGTGNSLLFHITALSVLWWVHKQWKGAEMRGYFNWQCIQQRGKCLVIFPSRLVGVWFFSLSQSRSPHLLSCAPRGNPSCLAWGKWPGHWRLCRNQLQTRWWLQTQTPLLL